LAHLLYARKSEEDDGRQVQSIGDQLKLACDLAEQKGLKVIDILQEARSAKRPGRPVFNEMLARIEAGEADGIIAWHPDRLARNAVDAGLIIDLLDRGKLRDLKFGSYTFENSPEGKWMLGIVLGQSKYFVDKLSTDVKRGIRGKLERGQFPGKAPAGYLNDLPTRSVVPDPERFGVLQKAMKEVIAGSRGVAEVLDRLNSEGGYRTRKTPRSGGAELSRSQFYAMLKNPFYTGMMKHAGELYQGNHVPMVTFGEFEQIQQLLGREGISRRHEEKEEPEATAVQKVKREFDFTGLMRCGRCGCRVTAEAKTKFYPKTGNRRRYVYYHCTNGKGGCSKQCITQEQVEAQVSSLLSRVTIQPWVVEWCLEPARKWHLEESGIGHEVIESLERALAGAERRKTNLLNERLSHPELWTVDEFMEHKEALQSEIRGLERDLRIARENLQRVRETVENVFDFATNAKRRFDKGGPALRREIARKLGVKYCLTLGTLEIEPHPLLSRFLTIEPVEIRSVSRKEECTDAMILVWQAIQDDIRTSASDKLLTFDRINWEAYGCE